MFKCLADGVVAAGTEKNLTSLQLTYANTTKPSTRWSSAYGTGVNEIQQLYHDSLGESGMLMSTGGSETLEEYLERGAYYHYSFTRDAEDRSTQVQLSTTFSSLEVGANIFIISWFSRAIELTTTNGQIQSVRSLSV